MTLEEFLASKTPEFREKVKKEHSQMVLQHAISRLRYEQNLTQEEVARKLQLSQSVVGKIEFSHARERCSHRCERLKNLVVH